MAAPATQPRGLLAPAVETLRVPLQDGASTTVYVTRHPLARTQVRVHRLPHQQPLASWCARRGISEALVGGFYTRPLGTPLGELRTGGVLRDHVPFTAPWDAVRACLHVDGTSVTLARRGDLPTQPAGDLLQAGPLLVRDGLVVQGDDEGFSAGAHQFDSDITEGRHPRAAIAVTAGEVLAVACDGRADDEAGLTLPELAETLVALGARSALNLDGGGSTSLVSRGELVNVPRESHGIALPAGRAVTTAISFRAI